MADTPITIPISVLTGNLAGLDAIERRLIALRQAASTLQAGWESTPYGIRRVGYGGGIPAPYRPPAADPLTQQPRPGGLRPFPGGFPPPVFGPGAPAPQPPPLVGQGGPPTVPSPMSTVAPPPGWAPPTGPFSAWPGSVGQRAMGWVNNPPGAGTPGGWGGGAGGGGAGGGSAGAGGAGGGGLAGMGPMGMLGRTMARLPGIALGYGAYQLLSAGMQSYEDRFRGVLQIGSMLQGQYEAVDKTILDMREHYQILARDGAASIRTLVHATGSAAGASGSARVGRAYGFEREALALQGRLALSSTDAVPDLAAITGIYNQGVRDRARISLPRFAEEVTAIGEVGGFQAARLTTAQYGRYGEYMTDFGGRFGAHPAQAYAEHFAGLQGPTGALGESVRMTALGRLRQGRRYIPFEGGFLDLQNPMDLMIAQQQAAQIPEVEQAYLDTSQQLGGQSESLRQLLFGQAYGIENVYEARKKYQGAVARAGRPGGLPGLINAPGPAEEATNITQQLDAQKELEGFRLRLQDVAKEMGDETAIIEGLKRTQGQLLEAYRKGIEVWNNTHEPITTATEMVGKLGKEAFAAASVFVAVTGALLGSPLAAALGLTAAGVVAGTEVYQNPQIYTPYFGDPARNPEALNLLPRKQGP